MHHRLAPKVHHFQHDIFMFYLDLDELDFIAKNIFLFGHNRRNLYSFRDADHEPAGEIPLKERIIKFLGSNGIDLGPFGRIMLLTLPRVAGYIFNPISIYYCFNTEGKPVCAVAEVGNTFREMKLYLLGADALDVNGVFCKTMAKHFYVSPFTQLDLNFDFRLKIPDGRLDIKIDDCEPAANGHQQKILISTLAGKQVELTNWNLARLTIEFPLVTLKVIFLIHWHALLIWLKRVPFYRKAGKIALQRDVLRPHSTLTARFK